MTSYKLNFSDNWLVLFVFSWLKFGIVHCKISKDAEYCMFKKNLKQMGCGVKGVAFRFVSFFFLDVLISLSVCGRTLGFFLFITLFYVIALCKMTLNKVCLSDSRDNLP